MIKSRALLQISKHGYMPIVVKGLLLFLSEKIFHFVFMDHYLLIGVFTGYRVFDGFYHLDEIPSGSYVCCSLGNFCVFGYFSH